MNNIPSSLKDNRKRGNIGDFLKQQINPDSKLSTSQYMLINN